MCNRTAPAKPMIPANLTACEPAVIDFEAWTASDWLYTYYDRDGIVLYVGRARDPHVRALAHRSKSIWWRFVASADVICIDLSNRVMTEAELIAARRPLFNVRQADATPVRAIEYAARREAWDIVDQLTAKITCHHCGSVTHCEEAA